MRSHDKPSNTRLSYKLYKNKKKVLIQSPRYRFDNFIYLVIILCDKTIIYNFRNYL